LEEAMMAESRGKSKTPDSLLRRQRGQAMNDDFGGLAAPVQPRPQR
jgi:hypothetical protein